MKWKTHKEDGTRESKAGVFECIVFQYATAKESGWWEYGVMSKSGSETFKMGHARTPETCMKQCEQWIKKHIETIKKDLKK